jgi:hypothetical protein
MSLASKSDRPLAAVSCVLLRSAAVSDGLRHPAPGTRHPALGTRHPAPGTRHPALGTPRVYRVMHVLSIVPRPSD